MKDKDRPMNRPNSIELSPALPGAPHLGPLKDLASEVARASAHLEGAVAPRTAQAIGEKLRLLNSYHSNLIEGHKTYIPDIEQAMGKRFSGDAERRYAQELCAAHVEAERAFMARVLTEPTVNVSSREFLAAIHREFYSRLPAEHQFTHSSGGFTRHPVMPGQWRNMNVSVHPDQSQHGPDAADLPAYMEQFEALYAPGAFHGDEKLIAAAAAHLKLAWVHPFRDGNGRTTRLHSGLFLAAIGVNRANLWSLSRGMSHHKADYMVSLNAGDPQPVRSRPGAVAFYDGNVALWCEYFLETCLDQIRFMGQQLDLHSVIGDRIDYYLAMRATRANALKPESSRLLRAVFLRGEVARGEAPAILNMPERSARRVVNSLLNEGLLTSVSPKSPLLVGFPIHVLPHYFPALYNVTNYGAEYMREFAG